MILRKRERDMSIPTPIPWKVSGGSILADVERGIYKSYPVAYMNISDPDGESGANAAFIVQCVNNHARLLGVVEEVVANLPDRSGDYLAVLDTIVEHAKAALRDLE